eukprot:CAMPEP_0179686250 /NCGR_PEP_ID=MMETSP0936-20121108/1520_1 /TAXON_ID=548131 ORGANISM="Ostreococcus mediterraneus, Strain clade-D-RCC2573" /NCGR_SAMPLE_ID=MMETSP0936 /ASSEMBLY_ACC=CAM_ASM_000574 /LENGTH=86 /DNA_ID=CAMNT_0021558693 /DNA_START=842 /DNA_END=1102 /DNA_ORIENTATION=+
MATLRYCSGKSELGNFGAPVVRVKISTRAPTAASSTTPANSSFTNTTFRRNAFFADVNDENLDGNITINACTIGIARSTVALSTIS